MSGKGTPAQPNQINHCLGWGTLPTQIEKVSTAEDSRSEAPHLASVLLAGYSCGILRLSVSRTGTAVEICPEAPCLPCFGTHWTERFLRPDPRFHFATTSCRLPHGSFSAFSQNCPFCTRQSTLHFGFCTLDFALWILHFGFCTLHFESGTLSQANCTSGLP